MAADKDMRLPAVYPNYTYTTDGKFYRSMMEEEHEILPADTREYVEDETEETDTKTVSEQNEEAVSSDEVVLTENEENTGKGTTDANDPAISKQWFHDTIDTFNAWKVTKGAGVKVAVLDSGINTKHIEFANRLEAVNKVTTVLGVNGAEDNYGHGTHVAGIIGAAANNASGGVGVAPEVSILSVKVLDNGGITGLPTTGSTADICAGINYAAEQGARVINMSLGGLSDATDIILQETITNAADKGIAIVAAAGNSTSDNKKVKVMPACADGVIAVSSTTPANELAWYSNYGLIDVAAPGGAANGNDAESIWSASLAVKNGYEYMDGTSMASPVAAGAAALVVASDSSLTHDRAGANKIADKLKSTAVNIGNKNNYGAGLVNASAAVGAISIYSKTGTFDVVSKKSIQLLAKYSSKDKVTWSVSDTAAATISKSGRLKAGVVAQKTTVSVTAAIGNASDTVTVTIYPQVGAIKSLSDKSITLDFYGNSGKTAVFKVQCDTPYTFKSSNSKVAVVNKNGVIRGVANGAATITATAVGGKKATMKVKVTGTPYKISKVVPAQSKLEKMGEAFKTTYLAYLFNIPYSKDCSVVSAGKSIKLKAVAEWPYTTSSNKKLEWSCSNVKTVNDQMSSDMSVRNGVVKVSKNIDTPIYGEVTAKSSANSAMNCVVASKAMKSFHFGNEMIIFKVKNSTSASVTAGGTTDVEYTIIVPSKADVRSQAFNPYPYIVSTDESVATADLYGYNKITGTFIVQVKGNKAGKCKIYLYSMDGAYKKATINVTVN